MAQDNQGPTGVKDLGGLVNKDIAYSKVPENVVFDSKNFRITTDDGGTLAVRSTIKGNEEIIANTQINQTICTNSGKIRFDFVSTTPILHLVDTTIRTTIHISSPGISTNVYYDHYVNPDNFIINHPNLATASGPNQSSAASLQYIDGLMNFLNSNSVAQQAGIVIDTTNYITYDDHNLGLGLNIIEYSYTSKCNTTITIQSVINLTATDSNGLTYLGYFNDPYVENFVLRDSPNGYDGSTPFSSLYGTSQAQGFLPNYNQIFDSVAAINPPYLEQPVDYLNQLTIISEYNQGFVGWDPALADTNTSTIPYFLPVEKTSNITDSTTGTVIAASSNISYLKIQDRFKTWGLYPDYLRNTAIASVNLLDVNAYSGGTWYFDLSYYLGKMSSNISLTVKVYINLHQQGNGPKNTSLVNISGVTTTGSTPLVNEFPTVANPTYFPPNTNVGNTFSDFNQILFGGNNVTAGTYYTDLHTLVYSETFTTGSQNRLESANNNVKFNINFPASLASLGANIAPTISVFLEPNYIGVPSPGWDYEFFLDKLDVRGPVVINGTSLVSNNLQITSNNVTTTTSVGTPYPQDLLIGWCTLRDDLYLFFTNGKEDPDDSTTWSNPSVYTPGTKHEIWKFTYDKAGNYKDPTQYSSIFNFQLIYSNPALDFTIYRPIANPGMIESRYENAQIQKIYWTDNYNVPRQINVADPNVASLTVDQLNLQPILTMDIPLVTEVIDTGSLLMGVYQVLYRLKTINGAETRFGPGSQLIPIIDAPESTASLRTYFPAGAVGTSAAKSIAVEVSNLDTDYDTIEFVLVYYDNDNTPKTIDIVKEEFIPADGYVKTTITGGENPVPITIDELTAFTTSIKRCKTLAAKKQTLFLGNILTGSSTVNWDARAYRFSRNTNQTKIKDDLGNSYLLDYNSGTYTLSGEVDLSGNVTTYSSPIPVGITHDCIQDYNSQAPSDDTKYLYKPNSNVLGGAGPNVSYEFITGNVELDANNSMGVGGTINCVGGSATGSGIAGPFIDYIYAVGGTKLSPGTEPQFPYHGNSIGNNQSPFTYDMLVGYRRDEMYRFGIVFFDELDNPTYVNWIADIRMPHIYMPATSQGSSIPNNSTPNIPGAGNTRTRIGVKHSRYTTSDFLPANGVQFTSDIITWGTNDGANLVVSKPLGIRFTIDFSTVPSQYKRAAIVRVPKEDGDRNILGQGIARPTYKQTNTGASYNVFTCSPYVNNLYDINNPTSGNFNEIWSDCWTINSPEFQFDDFPGFAGGDQVDFVSLLDNIDYSFLRAGNDTDPNAGLWAVLRKSIPNKNYLTGIKTKLYNVIESPTIPAVIKNSNSLNPYNLVTAFAMPHAGGYNKGLSRPYRAGNTVGPSAIRTVYNASPRDINNLPGGGVAGLFCNYPGYSYGGKTVFFQIDPSQEHNWTYPRYWGNTTIGTAFFDKDNWGANSGGFPNYIRQYLVNYKRTPASQFGGNSYFQRATNEYIPCNNLINISNKSNPITFNLFGGDTRITVTGNTTQFFDYAEASEFDSSSTVDLTYQMHFYPIETSIAVDFRKSANNNRAIIEGSAIPDRFNIMQLLAGWAAMGAPYWYNAPRISQYEHFEVDKVFNHTDKSVYTYFPAPALSTPPNRFDCRIWKSEPKIDGELSESWSIFKPSAYKDVESAYGPINNLIIFRDKMYYFQDKGFGIAQVDEQKLVQAGDSAISDLVLGSSGILERYDYISTKTGTKHQFSMSVSDYSIIWFDSLARKVYRYKGEGLEPLSDIKGLNAFLYNRTAGDLQVYDNPYLFRGIHSTYDFRHNEFYITFLAPAPYIGTIQGRAEEPTGTPLRMTLVYNDLFDGFIGEYTHYPKVYINDKINIFSPKPTTVAPEIFFIHNYGQYGRFYNQTPDFAELSFVLNTSSTTEKVLQNLEFVSEAYTTNTIQDTKDIYLYDQLAEVKYQDFFDSMRIFDNYQNTDWITLIPNRLDLSSRDNYARKHKTIWDVRVPSDRVLDVNQNIFSSGNLSPVRPRLTKRLKDKWFMVQLVYNNANNNKLVVHSAKPNYALNSR